MNPFQHLALQAVRRAIAESFRMVEKTASAMFGGQLQIWEVCQMPERECETVYLVGDSGNVVRIRIDGVPGDQMVEFMRGEPGVELHQLVPDGGTVPDAPLDPNAKVPDDASALLRGELGL